MKIIEVEIPGNSYSVLTGENTLTRITEYTSQRKIFYVIDTNVLKLHREYLVKNIPGISDDNTFVLNASEKNKSLDTVQEIYKLLLDSGAGRDAVLCGIGGGITGDITGFAAATFMRGISYIQVPTTLLAAVDSSTGGKTGVNFNGIKNIIGAFYQPEVVISDNRFFSTLSDKEILCGLGEIVKYAFLAGGEYYEKLGTNSDRIFNPDNEILDYFIAESVLYKARVVAEDEKEAGLRKVLNLGHTYGHGLETALNFEIKHGEAVIAGIVCALHLAKDSGIMENDIFTASIEYLKPFTDKITFNIPSTEAMITVMKRDKKNRDGKIKFVLPAAPGEIALDVEADIEQVEKSIINGLAIFE